MAIFLKFADVKGNSTDSKFKDQIVIESFQWGAGLSVGSSNAKGADRALGKASVSEITVTKHSDKSSQLLFKALLMGKQDNKATISFVATAKGESVAYAVIDLENVIVSGFSQSSGGEVPSESLSLNFTKFDWTWNDRDSTGKATPTHLVYDLAQAKTS
ncbi:type VI secretion system tube protein Hcp [Novosphingobium sp.]|uniref:Hcp family type VI secretion system effector n=1 Tax=Novosphingobium sp. TaxID=1874826 RepID=UPI0025DDF6E3|nr:type VI secretion system tube protein Hcp [Novosphingobium sp.]